MARRYRFTMPRALHQQDERPVNAGQPDAAELLSQFPGLPEINPDDRGHTRALTFGAGERLFNQGDELEGVYFVVSGSVSLQVIKGGEAREIARIHDGEFCGETGMHGRQTADIRAVAMEDTVVALIAPDVVPPPVRGESSASARDGTYSRSPPQSCAIRTHRGPAPHRLGDRERF
jgi:hypothetical protein